MKLSLCITTFNRSDMVMEVFEKVYDHPVIDEIVIVDDASDPKYSDELGEMLSKHPAKHKIQQYRNLYNLGMSRNKAEAVSKAKNEWCILFDSDNILYPEYLDAAQKAMVLSDEDIKAGFSLSETTIFHPSFAEPEHDYSELPININSYNAKDYLGERDFRCMLNNCNYIVNRDEYLRVYKYDESIKESDTIYFNTLWLEAGNGFYIVPGMKYHHRKHSGSGWINGDHRYNMNKAAELQEKIKNL